MQILTGDDHGVLSVSDTSKRVEIVAYLELLEEQVRRYPRLVLMIGDRGSLLIVATLLATARSSDGTTTLAAIEAIIVGQRIATGRRVRALVDWLDHCGAVVREAATSDRRRRPLRPAATLLETLGSVADALTRGAGEGAPREPLDRLVDLLVTLAREAPALPAPIADLIERRAGYLLLLTLVGRAQPAPDGTMTVRVSRKAMAARYRLSRAHLTALLARLERHGWVERRPDGTIRLDAGLDRLALAFLAQHLRALGALSRPADPADGPG